MCSYAPTSSDCCWTGRLQRADGAVKAVLLLLLLHEVRLDGHEAAAAAAEHVQAAEADRLKKRRKTEINCVNSCINTLCFIF